eukprot:5695603-Amphidinium_carterae.1
MQGWTEDSKRREQHSQAPSHLTKQASTRGTSRPGGGYHQALLASYTEAACTRGQSDSAHATSRRVITCGWDLCKWKWWMQL